MTTAEKYRQLEKSPLINTARYIFNSLSESSRISTIGDEIEEIKTGKTPSKQEKRYYEDNYFDWFKPNEVGSEKYLYQASEKLSKYAVESNQVTIYEPDTILINAIGDIGRISILKNKASSNQQITGIRFKSQVLADFAYYYLVSNRAYFYVDLFKTTLPIVNQKKINTIPIIIPKIEVQKKIVSGLESLEMLKSMNDFHIIESLDWDDSYKALCKYFYILHFDGEKLSYEQDHQLDLLKKLRQQILQDAVQGKLVPQDPNDEPASELLERIKAEKEQLVRDKKIKKDKPLPEIKPEEIPFDIPENWVWCRLGGIISILGDGLHGTPKFTETGEYYFINGNNLIDDVIQIKDSTKRASYEEYLKYKKPMTLNTVFVSINGTLGNLGFYNNEKIILGKSACYFNLLNGIHKHYIGKYIKSTYFLQYAIEVASETTIKNVSLKAMRNLPIPLPPYNEQHRIVTKIEQLMTLFDELEQSIRQNQKHTQELLQVALKEALEPNKKN